ncbi:MAG: toxin TcdB middle/N-terminal domain-containing protein, partial [Pseudomonadota bacterium]
MSRAEDTALGGSPQTAPGRIVAPGLDMDKLDFTGSARMSIPIEVPPGRKGIDPRLALTYDSRRGNGWVGQGWAINIGAIERSTKHGIDYGKNDFVFESEELVPREDWGVNCYGRKIEGEFSRFYFNSSTQGWEVTTKDGIKHYYGSSSFSRQELIIGQIFKWYLDKVEDTNGNYMTVSYTPLHYGEIYVDTIQYTGNQDLAPEYSVHFFWDVRPDQPVQYTYGVPTTMSFRLNTISVSFRGDLVRKYVLEYKNQDEMSPTAQRSVLGSVTQYGSDGVSAFPPISIDYYVDGEGYFSQYEVLPCIVPETRTGENFYNYNMGPLLWARDYDGDGRCDILFRNNDKMGLLSGGLMTLDYLPWSCHTWMPIPNTVSFKQYLWMEDFNGDGKTDSLRLFNNVMARASGESLDVLCNLRWMPHHHDRLGPLLQPGDFNGDGKVDVSFFGGSDELLISWGPDLSDNSYRTGLHIPFTICPLIWPIPNYLFKQDYWYRPGPYYLVADFNGDGKSDILWVRDSQHHVAISWGGTLNTYNCLDWTLPVFNHWTGDFNGDGRADIVFCETGQPLSIVYGGDSSSLNSKSQLTWGLPPFSDMLTGDFNGDGRTDLLFLTGGYVNISYGGNLNSYTQCGIRIPWSSAIGYRLWTGDFNGDGKDDIIFYEPGQPLRISYAPAGIPDLIKQVSNGLGATTTFTYKPSSEWTNHLLPFTLPTLSSVTVSDGNGITSRTDYGYSGGLYDRDDREFRGFEHVISTDSTKTTEKWFHQDRERKGLPYHIVVKDLSGNVYSEILKDYDKSSPYSGVTLVSLRQENEYTWDGTGTCVETSTEYDYDDYGNMKSIKHHGDVSKTGDEKCEETTYEYDTARWVLSLPQTKTVKDADGKPVAKSSFVYYPDGKGNLWKKVDWLDLKKEGEADPETSYTYDPYGNVETIKNPRGYTTTTTYDGLTHTYHETSRNQLGHTATKTYDLRYGKPLTERDQNDNLTAYEYDVFGRLIRVTNPKDTGSTYGTGSYYYLDFGTVGAQRITTYTTEVNGTGQYTWNDVYFDGLGRAIEKRGKGPEGKTIVTETVYDDQGRVCLSSLPYFMGSETPKWTTYYYDPVGRTTDVHTPDNKTISRIYDKFRTVVIDENNHVTVEGKDAYGRLSKKEEYTGEWPSPTLYATTNHTYDALGNLTVVTDTQDNQTIMTYDSLSRKRSMTEPDMGSWKYDYDANGNLEFQTDPRSQTTRFFYDEIGRLDYKDFPNSPDVDFVYDEAFSPHSKGRLTTVIDASGTTRNYYDELGRTTRTDRIVDGTAYSVRTAYDALGRVIGITYPDGEQVSYLYEGGFLKDVPGFVTYEGHNASGQAKRAEYANGVVTEFDYYPENKRLQAIVTSIQEEGHPEYLQKLYYVYDNAGNVKSITDTLNTDMTQVFHYDELNRLDSARSNAYGRIDYCYDDVGNMTYNSQVGFYVYDQKPHAVRRAGQRLYSYDSRGNLACREA